MKFKAIFFLCLTVVMTGCGLLSKKGGGSGQASKTTGWNYNDPENGGFQSDGDYSQIAGPGLIFIEGGTFTMGRVEQDVMYDWNNSPRLVVC